MSTSNKQKGDEGAHTYSGWCFSVLIPNDMMVKKKSTMHDFELYEFIFFNNGNTVTLNAYVGNHPEIANTNISSDEHIVKLKNLKAKWTSIKTINCLYNADVLIDLNNDFPRYVHFWYNNADKDTKLTFDTIIKSIKYDVSFCY